MKAGGRWMMWRESLKVKLVKRRRAVGKSPHRLQAGKRMVSLTKLHCV